MVRIHGLLFGLLPASSGWWVRDAPDIVFRSAGPPVRSRPSPPRAPWLQRRYPPSSADWSIAGAGFLPARKAAVHEIRPSFGLCNTRMFNRSVDMLGLVNYSNVTDLAQLGNQLWACSWLHFAANSATAEGRVKRLAKFMNA
jgi:hypothetical protein